MRTDLFDFPLPPDRIATRPVTPRDAARLLHVRAAPDGGDELIDRAVKDIPALLGPGDVMVFNDTRVLPARLLGRRGLVAVEVLLHRPVGTNPWPAAWDVFAKPAKRLKPGQVVAFGPRLTAEVQAKSDQGLVRLTFNLSGPALFNELQAVGHIPLPPYIRRDDDARDRTDYQTVYAARDGSVAAPTAGLHFTPELLAAIDASGARRLSVTLHVGAGTFLPVKAEDTERHIMHAEWGEVSATTAEAVTRAKAARGRVIAVGTTSLRLLESAAPAPGRVAPFAGDTALFITPGYRFKAVDVLMTNFHLPKSTLFMLVSAFSGLARMKSAYAHAVAAGYRFYSYGDASWLERVEGP
jgi:S-adenosylmethionine:tRNA ribosyltransferase-isomerase